MATLQNIRNRGGLLISIFIGLALLAFVVGDGLKSGSTLFGESQNKIGEVAGKSIDAREYQNEIAKNEEFIKMMNGIGNLNEQQQYSIRNSTWQQMTLKAVMGVEYEETGIAVGSKELYDLLLGEEISPMVRQIFTNPQTGEFDIVQARQIIKSLVEAPDNSNQKMFWLNIEEQTKELREQTKYQAILAKSMFIPDAMIKDEVNNTNVKSGVSYLVKNYNTIADSTINVSDDEIRKYYNEHKNLFEQEETRRIAYVNFIVKPSKEDQKEALEWIEDLSRDFITSNDLKDFVNTSSDSKFDDYYYSKNEIEASDLANYAFGRNTNNAFGPYKKDETYNISRVESIKMLPDSVRVRHISISVTEKRNPQQAKALADSLSKLIAKGYSFDKLARKYSTDENTAANGGDLGWLTSKMLLNPVRDDIFDLEKGKTKVLNTNAGVDILQVVKRSKLVKKVRIATITKEITPSQNTINEVYNKARVFAEGLNNIEDFDKKVQASALTRRIANLDKNDRGIVGVEGSRDIVRHTYLTKDVNNLVKDREENPIFENGDVFTVAVLTNINHKGVSPINTVSSQIRAELIKDKKAEIIIKQINQAKKTSSDLNSIASSLNTKVEKAEDVSFNSLQFGGTGIEPNVISMASVLPKSQLSNPVQGNRGVYLLVVTDKVKSKVSKEDEKLASDRLKNMNIMRITRMGEPIQALLKNADIKDTRYKFY